MDAIYGNANRAMPKCRKVFVKYSYDNDGVLQVVLSRFVFRKLVFAYRYGFSVAEFARFTVHSLQFNDERAVPLRTSREQSKADFVRHAVAVTWNDGLCSTRKSQIAISNVPKDLERFHKMCNRG